MTVKLRRMVLLALCFSLGTTYAQNADSRLEALEQEMKMMREALSQKDEQIRKLEALVKQSLGKSSDDAQSLLDKYVADVDVPTTSTAGKPGIDLGGTRLNLAEVSVIVNVAAGASTLHNEDIGQIQGGAHDPNERGFTFQQLELSLAGSVDPYFNMQAHIIFLEDGVELEEAFAVSQALPANLELKAGYYFTEFGRMNSTHPHTWDFLDQPIINSRIFGGDGMRGAGARLAWLTALPWFSELSLGMQDATGERMASFLGEGLAHGHGEEHGEEEEEEHHFEEGIGGRPILEREIRDLEEFVYSIRLANSFEVGDDLSMQLGLSGLAGANNTGDEGETLVYGADLVVKHHPAGSDLRRPKWVWQTEIMKREYDADAAVIEEEAPEPDIVFAEDTIDDWGIYSQFVYTLNPDWSIGLRGEFATSDGDSYEEGEIIDSDADPFRGERLRISPVMLYHPSEFTRIRLQHNYDDADYLEDDDAHSLWLGFEWLIGKHPAHRY